MLINGVKRGDVEGKTDEVVDEPQNLEPDEWAVDEGLLAFVQSTLCQRAIVTTIYGNKTQGEQMSVANKHQPLTSYSLPK